MHIYGADIILKILIPMVEAGGGHEMPALAIKESIETLFPGQYQIDVIDFAREVGANWDNKIIKGFWIGLWQDLN